MAKTTFKQVKDTCAEDRYFSYVGWRDKTFSIPSVFFVWVFVRMGWSGNAVTLLSGAFAVLGGILLASNEPLYIVVGSFGYIIFYFLDYVDGGVARFNGKAGIGGQYMDLLMHGFSALAISAGILLGAIETGNTWIIPFGILYLLASVLSLERYTFGWFSICMHHQQQQVKGNDKEISKGVYNPRKDTKTFKLFRNFSTAIFHENYAIFLLPVLAVMHFFFLYGWVDFRVVLVLLGGTIYFSVILYDIWCIASDGRIDKSYDDLFYSKGKPKLPEDHYF